MHKVKDIREEKGMSGYELAARSGVSESNISRIERGIIKPGNVRVGTLHKLAKALGVRVDDFIDEKEFEGD